MIISQHGEPLLGHSSILDRFDRVAKQTECLTGHSVAFGTAVYLLMRPANSASPPGSINSPQASTSLC
jgi:hypothetical protein